MGKDAIDNSFLAGMFNLLSQRRERRVVTVGRWLRSIFRRPRELPPPTFEPLTPVDVEDSKLAVYESELISALRCPEIHNIAITGGYGAGKSSLIKSFVKRHPEYSCAFISLAAFDGTDDKSGGESTQDAIESTIVQQLLYSAPSRKVPGTRLRRISYVTRGRLMFATFAVFVALISYLRLINDWPSVIPDLSYSLGWIPEVLAKTGLALSLVLAIYWIIRIISNLRIQEISFTGVKWDGGAAPSVLHKHVDEIIHMFEMIPIDIVFVEDLDRFNDKSPFVRLREINFIVNSSAGISYPVRFVYALNDEIFGREDKAKFFDVIIPVVPVINSDNARDMFMSLLEQRVKGVSTDARVVQLVETVADYVGDLRQIKNMVNEFDLYRAVLKGGHVGDIAKELAMVAVRCIYPQAYADLLRGSGSIRNIFSMFPDWRNQQLDQLLAEQDELLRLEAKREADALDGAVEIMTLIWSRIEDQAGGNSITEINLNDLGRLGKSEFISSHDKIDQIATKGSVQLLRNGNFAGYANVRDILTSGEPSLSSRLALKLRPVEPDRRAIERVSARIEELRAMTLVDSLQDAGFLVQVADYCKVHELQLVPYLLRKGYLGADYSEYIGYFYPGVMSSSDKVALLNIRTGSLLDVDFQFTSPSLVLSKLSTAELGGGVGIITSLVMQVIDDSGCEESLRARRIHAIFSEFESNFERIDQLYKSAFQMGRLRDLIFATIPVYPMVPLEIAERGLFCSRAELRALIVANIAAEVDPSAAGEFMPKLVSMLSELPELEVVLSVDSKVSLEKWFNVKGARLREIASDTDKDALKTGLKRNAIRVNQHNVIVAARSLCGVEIEDAKFSNLRNGNLIDVIDFVKSDWIGYVESVYGARAPVAEDDSTLIEMLDFSAEYDGGRELVLRVIKSRVSNIDLIDPSLWEAVFESQDVIPSIDNFVLLAMEEKLAHDVRLRLAGSLLEEVISLEALPPRLNVPEVTEALCRLLTDLSESHGAKAARSIVDLNIGSLMLEMGDASQDLVDLVVKAGLPFTEDNFREVAVLSENSAAFMAISNFEAFLDYSSHYEVGPSVLSQLMQSSLLSVAERLRLLALISPEEIEGGEGLANACIEFIFNEGVDFSVAGIYEKELMFALLAHCASEEDLLRLLAMLLVVAPWRDVATHFSRLQESGFAAILGAPHRIEVADSTLNVKLLEVLRRRGIVGIPNHKNGRVWARVRTSRIKLD